jgi:hypothetical protein
LLLGRFPREPEQWGQEIAIWWKQNRSSGFLQKGDRMCVGHFKYMIIIGLVGYSAVVAEPFSWYRTCSL